MTGLTVVGVWFREIVLIAALILPFTSNPFQMGDLRARWRGMLPKLAPLGAGLLSMAAVRLVARSGNDYSFAWTAVFYIFKKSWPTYLLSGFLAFGPILWLAIFRARRGAAFLMGRQHLLVFLATFVGLADMGGSDTERFLYWTMPVVYVLIGLSLEDQRTPWPGWLLAIFAAAQLVASRAVFWPALPVFPGPVRHVWPLFTPFGRNIPFDDLYTDTAPRYLIVIALLEYLVFGAAVGIWVFWRMMRVGALAGPAGDRLSEGSGLRAEPG